MIVSQRLLRKFVSTIEATPAIKFDTGEPLGCRVRSGRPASSGLAPSLAAAIGERLSGLTPYLLYVLRQLDDGMVSLTRLFAKIISIGFPVLAPLAANLRWVISPIASRPSAHLLFIFGVPLFHIQKFCFFGSHMEILTQ